LLWAQFVWDAQAGITATGQMYSIKAQMSPNSRYIRVFLTQLRSILLSTAILPLESCLALMKPLQETEKLACILIQLPPGLKFKKERVEAFLKILPLDMRFALEYRNETWLTEEAHDLLFQYNVATVAVDEPLLPPEIRLTSDIAYVRCLLKILYYNYTTALNKLASL